MKLSTAITGVIALAGAATAQAASENPLEIQQNLQVWTLVTFLVLFTLLAKFTFKPIANALDRRGQMIKSSMDEAEKSRAEAKKLMDDYQKQLAEARSEAAKVIEEARLLGEKVRKEVVDKANAEAAASLQRAQEELQRQKEKSLQELKDTVASLSVQIAGQVIGKEVNPATHRQLVENLITDLGKIKRA